MTEAELQAIEARAEAATEGPWTYEPGTETEPGQLCAGSGHVMPGLAYLPGEAPQPDFEDDDGIFIAHARTDIPALVAEVRAANARAKAWSVAAKALGLAWRNTDSPHEFRHPLGVAAVEAVEAAKKLEEP